MRLEDKLMEKVKAGKEIDIERALLIFSGLNTEKEIAEYKLKLGEIDAGFQIFLEVNDINQNKPVEVAKALHKYLWKGKKERYNGNYFLTEVIEAQRSIKDQPVGSCVGLTALYTVLGLRHGLDLSVIVDPRHVLSRLKPKGLFSRKKNIENNSRRGFDGKIEKNFKEYHHLPSLAIATLINRADSLHKSKNFFGALENLITALDFNIEHSDLYSRMGSLKGAWGYHEDAIKDQEKSIELDPKNPYPYHYLVHTKLVLGDLEGAKEAYQKALKVKARDEDEFHNFGRVNVAMEDYQKAVKSFNKARKIEPFFVEAIYECGLAKAELDDLEGALDEFKAALELQPTHRDIFDKLTFTRLRLKDYQGALEDYDEFLALYPEDEDLIHNREWIRRTKEHEDANKPYQKPKLMGVRY